MQRAILFDLDDTLIDTRQRHYQIFSDFLKMKKLPAVSFADYIFQRKKNSLSNKALLLQLFPQMESGFDVFFQDAIESPDYLKYDKPIIKQEILEEIRSQNIKMFVLSLRSKKENALQQMQQFSFFKLIDQFIFFEHKQSFNQKADCINLLKKENEIKIFIGDSNYDKEAASLAGIGFCAVKTGMYKIDNAVIFDDVNKALTKILK